MPRLGWVYAAILLLALLPSSVVAGALPILQRDWSASSAEMGLIVGSYQLGYAAAVLLLLPLTDRLSSARVVLGGAVLAAIGSVAFALLATGPLSAAVFQAMAGAGIAGIYLPGLRIVAAAANERRRGMAVSVYVGAYYAAWALSLWLTGALVELADWRTAALVLGGLASLSLVLALPARRTAAPSARGRPVVDLGVLREDGIRRTILAYSGHSWELYVARGWLPALLASLFVASGADSTSAVGDAARWTAIAVGLGAFGTSVGGWASDRWGRARSAAVVASGSAALSVAIGLAPSAALLVVIACLAGFVMAADSGIYSTTITEIAPADRVGSAQAVQSFSGFLASAFAPVVAGAVLDAGLGYPAVFAVGAAGSVLAALAMLGLRSRDLVLASRRGPLIGRASAADLPAVEALLTAAGLPPDGVGDAFRYGVVARERGVAVGAAAVEPYGHTGLLRSVVVRADRRGAGLGCALVAAAEALAREQGIRDLYLLTETATTWFLRLGYVAVERAAVPPAVAGSVQFTLTCSATAVAMVRRLG